MKKHKTCLFTVWQHTIDFFQTDRLLFPLQHQYLYHSWKERCHQQITWYCHIQLHAWYHWYTTETTKSYYGSLSYTTFHITRTGFDTIHQCILTAVCQIWPKKTICMSPYTIKPQFTKQCVVVNSMERFFKINENTYDIMFFVKKALDKIGHFNQC